MIKPSPWATLGEIGGECCRLHTFTFTFTFTFTRAQECPEQLALRQVYRVRRTEQKPGKDSAQKSRSTGALTLPYSYSCEPSFTHTGERKSLSAPTGGSAPDKTPQIAPSRSVSLLVSGSAPFLPMVSWGCWATQRKNN